MKTPGDEEIAFAVVRGDDGSADKFVEHFGALISAYVARFNVPAADRQDICQEILIDALRQLRAKRFKGRAGISTWLFRISVGKTADYWRRSRVKALPLPPTVHGAGRWAAQELDVLESEILHSLPADHEAMFRQFYLEGRRVEAIARERNLSARRVWAILKVAKTTFTRAVRDWADKGNDGPARPAQARHARITSLR